MKNKIAPERVRELFDYNSKDGCLIRKIATSNSSKVGSTVGSLSGNGRLYTSVDSVLFPAHILIFLWHHGYISELFIDHIDRNPLNNKIENLREVSYQCNARNAKPLKNNTSGVKGVTFRKNENKWVAQIGINGKMKMIGSFINFVDAVKARYNKEVELNWNGCNSTSCSFLYLKENNILDKPDPLDNNGNQNEDGDEDQDLKKSPDKKTSKKTAATPVSDKAAASDAVDN